MFLFLLLCKVAIVIVDILIEKLKLVLFTIYTLLICMLKKYFFNLFVILGPFSILH